ncbi:hypothetical protein PG997_004828 [Apiospora hydei]|uniref:Uncharacterized protein n=1 Tax=Apiospora hydei TaxID=1337664 RepID=A0ABR1X3E3_9PEZI
MAVSRGSQTAKNERPVYSGLFFVGQMGTDETMPLWHPSPDLTLPRAQSRGQVAYQPQPSPAQPKAKIWPICCTAAAAAAAAAAVLQGLTVCYLSAVRPVVTAFYANGLQAVSRQVRIRYTCFMGCNARCI